MNCCLGHNVGVKTVAEIDRVDIITERRLSLADAIFDKRPIPRLAVV